MPTAPETAGPKIRGFAFKLGVTIVAVALIALIAEGVARYGFPLPAEKQERLRAFREYAVDQRHAVYVPHAYTAYAPHNWHEQFSSNYEPTKRAGVLRIACLGGSTTEGGRAWPSHLERWLNTNTDGQAEVMNWGVSGWTTVETMTNYFLNVQDWEPDLVLIHHAANDVLPRLHPNYRTDYAHFRHPWERLQLHSLERWLLGVSDLYARLQMDGVQTNVQSRVGFPLTDRRAVDSGLFPSGTTASYKRNLSTIVDYTKLRGGTAALLTMPYNPKESFRDSGISVFTYKGTLEHNQIARELAQQSDCLLIDLASSFDAKRAKTEQMFKDGVHLGVAGHQLKARLVGEALVAAGIVTRKP